MSSRPLHLAIDARPRGPRGLMAAEVVLGRSMLGHLLDLAESLESAGEPVVIHARPEEQRELQELAGNRAGSFAFASGAPRADALVLRTDRFYDAGRLRRRLRLGQTPESAVIWRLDRPESLLAADEELTRRLTYQPIGKYWAFPLARRLAEALASTSVRPNMVTLAAGALMLLAAGLVATGAGAADWIGRLAVAALMALALVLDTADGRLARLQGTSSAFGRWLDQFLDELSDMALHAAIAWWSYSRAGLSHWLVIGMLYSAGKYLFLAQSTLGDELERRSSSRTRVSGSDGAIRHPRGVAGLAYLVGHADVRWHLWIVLAAAGRLDFALVTYAAYFPLRVLAGAIRKGARYA
jgi:phosphatidylglycerophosphate synthase